MCWTMAPHRDKDTSEGTDEKESLSAEMHALISKATVEDRRGHADERFGPAGELRRRTDVQDSKGDETSSG